MIQKAAEDIHDDILGDDLREELVKINQYLDEKKVKKYYKI